jgi:hypothetical protein
MAEFPAPQTTFEFSTAVALSAIDSMVIDGHGDEDTWQRIPWSEPFVDIRGFEYEPAPYYETKIKMAWDEEYFYVLAWLEEPHLWATYDEHDMVIFHENDFEVFIDPDGDLHNYLELEINALGTTWDLMLTAPYRDNGQAIDSWEIPGLKTGIYLDGTLNDPSDEDNGWGVELAIPWDVITEVDNRERFPGQTHSNGMRINFSRVQWQLDIDLRNGTYTKQLDSSTDEPLPENNWVWSAQGLIAMHYPERWGRVRFQTVPPHPTQGYWGIQTDPLREMTMLCYYAQKKFRDERDVYASKMKSLDLPKKSPYPDIDWPPEILWMRGGFQMDVQDGKRREGLRIREDGRLISSPYRGTWFLDYVRGARPAPNNNQRSDD